jgi:hypothetical protein
LESWVLFVWCHQFSLLCLVPFVVARDTFSCDASSGEQTLGGYCVHLIKFDHRCTLFSPSLWSLAWSKSRAKFWLFLEKKNPIWLQRLATYPLFEIRIS